MPRDMIDYLSDAELCRLLTHCLTHRDEHTDLVLWILGTGVRVGEISGCVRKGKRRGGILLSDVRIDGPQEMYATVWGEKTDQERKVAVMPEVVPHLTHRVERLRTAGKRWLFQQPVRPRSTDKRTLQRWWKGVLAKTDCLNRAGEPWHIHMGRHTYACWEALRMPLVVLQDQLGHARGSKTTLKYYAVSMPEFRYFPDRPVRWRELLKKAQPERRLRLA